MTNFHAVRHGSGREVLKGLIRSLPDPESAGLVRAGQVARRLPRMAREMRPHVAATCEVAGMLASELQTVSRVAAMFASQASPPANPVMVPPTNTRS